MAEHLNEDCCALVKYYYRHSLNKTLTRETARQIQQRLLERVNAGSANQKLFLFLNRLTNGLQIRQFVDFRNQRQIYPEKIQPLLLLYEYVIEGADSPASVPYLLQALHSTCAERVESPTAQIRQKLLAEEQTEESGPDQCGHQNRRISHYKTYLFEMHYALRRPLVEKARTQLLRIAKHFPELCQQLRVAVKQSEEQERQGYFGVEVREETVRELDQIDVLGDSGYW
jgi:hypothetical protein